MLLHMEAMLGAPCFPEVSAARQFVSICFAGSPIYKTIQMRCARGGEVGIIRLMEPTSTILIVDDDRDIRSLLADYLETNAYRTLGAADGTAMWKILDETRPDLIVLDLMMPGEDGLSICRTLRSQHYPGAILMLTARTDDLDQVLGLELGADDYLVKPFQKDELLARLNALVRRSAGFISPRVKAGD